MPLFVGRFVGRRFKKSQRRGCHQCDSPCHLCSLVVGLVGIALWLWMARANGQGRSWARILSTVLFALATLQLIGDLQQAVSPAGTIEPVLGLLLAVLVWLPGLAAVWLLWRPASSAFFKPHGFTQALPRQVLAVLVCVPTRVWPGMRRTKAYSGRRRALS